MSHETLLVARLFFWVLVAASVALPVRWGVIAYVLLAQFDITGAAFYSSEFLGWENAVKIAVVPTVLFLKVRTDFVLNHESGRIARTWLLLTAYAALSVLWSPFKLSGIKMLGYFYAYAVLFVIFSVSWRKGWLTAQALTGVLWVSLGFAALQTYSLGNDYGSFAANNGTMDFEWRFTTFGSAQSFAAFLLCLMVLLLFRERRTFFVWLSCAGASAGILLTGSRSTFLGLAWILILAGVLSAKKHGKRITLGLALKRMMLSAAVILCMAAVVFKVLPQNRLNQMLTAAVSSNNSVQDVGTFLWRFNLYQTTLDALRARTPKALLTGTGTSSGAALVLQAGIYSQSNVDPNRTLHNEFLRSTYEWGLIGLGLLLFFLYQATSICFVLIRTYDANEAWAFLAILGPLLISLGFENFLADSASPGGVGYNLLLTSMLACTSLYREAISPATTASAPSLTFYPAGDGWSHS